MLRLAAAGCRAPGPRLRAAGCWGTRLLLERCPAAWEPGELAVVARRRPEPPGVWRGAARASSGRAGREQVPPPPPPFARPLLPAVLFPHVESLCCFSTSSLHDSSEYGRLVYRGNLAKMVLGVRFFSYSTSILSLCTMPFIIFKTGIGVDSLPLQIAFFSIIGFFTLVSPVALHLLTKGYVIRLYHKAETDTYTAITYNVILAEKKTMFHQKDVKVPDISKMFTTFYARTKSMLVNPGLFQYPQDFSHLMGYDKPFTFDLEESEESTEGKKNSKISDV